MWSELKRYKRTRLIFAAILASAFAAGVISCSCTGGLHSLSLSAQRFAAKCVALPAATDGIGICIATALNACLIPVLLCLFSYLFGFTVYSPPVSGAAVAAFSFCMGAVCAATASPDIPYLLRALLCILLAEGVGRVGAHCAYLGITLLHRAPANARVLFTMPEVRRCTYVLCSAALSMFLLGLARIVLTLMLGT